MLVQASAYLVGFAGIHDLRDDLRFRKKRNCEFSLPRNDGRFDLFECKRTHPASASQISSEAEIAAKLYSILKERAMNQLDESAKVIGNVASRHVLLDVSGYVNRSWNASDLGDSVKIFGFTKEQVTVIAEEFRSLLAKEPHSIGEVTLCWRQIVRINGKFHAIIHNATTIFRRPGSTPSEFQYQGWTLEAYPMEKKDYRELRVSNCVRTLGEIMTSYNDLSHPQSFFGVGPERTYES